MIRSFRPLGAALFVALAASGPAAAQQIENELVLITPVARTLTDPAKDNINFRVRLNHYFQLLSLIHI